MTSIESKWAARVAAWRSSGQGAPAYCRNHEFSPASLYAWARRLSEVRPSATPRLVRVERVVGVGSARSGDTRPARAPLIVEVGGARVHLESGFDPEVLRAVVAALGGAR